MSTPYDALVAIIPADSLLFKTEEERLAKVKRVAKIVAEKQRQYISMADDEERTTIQLIENEWVRVTGKDSVAELMLAAGAYYAQENNLA